jgi:hypothetical protein
MVGELEATLESPRDTDAYRRGGHYVLKGAKPSDLPVELPTRYELVFNLATAKELKSTFRPSCSPSPTK